MPISFSEVAQLECPNCGTAFAADVWALIDAAERPDLAEALREDQLNMAVCPSCEQVVPAGTPVLFHDPASRRVYFAVPPGADEHRWREQAQELLYALVNSLPEEQRRPYLGDVQVEQELAGVRRAVLRRSRGRAASASAPPVTREPAAKDPAPAPEHVPLFEAARALVSANSEAEFAEVLERHPELLSEASQLAIHQLADRAYSQGDRELGDALQAARATLARMPGGAAEPAPPAEQAPQPGARDVQTAAAGPQPGKLPEMAYQALLHATTPQQLVVVARDYPALLEPWAEADLAARVELALDEGNESLARTIEQFCEALAELRAQVSGQDQLLAGVRALIGARSDDAIAEVLAEYPMLLTDAAQDALLELAASARASGDRVAAEYAISCRTMLRTIRAGLEES